MGVCGSSNNEELGDENPITKQDPNSNKVIRNISEMNYGTSNFVFEKKGKITAEYKLLSPPIGNGSYGVVRKCIHLDSQQYRAVKIVSKDKASEKQVQLLVREIEMLKRMVFSS